MCQPLIEMSTLSSAKLEGRSGVSDGHINLSSLQVFNINRSTISSLAGVLPHQTHGGRLEGLLHRQKHR